MRQVAGRHTIYRCVICGYRAFGAPVFVHEVMLKHRMVPEVPDVPNEADRPADQRHQPARDDAAADGADLDTDTDAD